jgi:carboxyl-terminal processing protease
MEVLKGSGAEAAGLKKSDVITQIDSKNIESLQLLEVVPLIRGEPGTTVLLTIQRTGEIKPLIVTVTRHIVKFPPPEEQ